MESPPKPSPLKGVGLGGGDHDFMCMGILTRPAGAGDMGMDRKRASLWRTPSLFYLGSMSAWMTGVKNVPDQRIQVIKSVHMAFAV
jgi:hypothetical protein